MIERERNIMLVATKLTKKNPTIARKIIKYLVEGIERGITSKQITQRYKVKNTTSIINSVRTTVEKYGNWRLVEKENRNGDTVYSIKRIALLAPSVPASEVKQLEEDSFFYPLPN